MKKLFLSLLLLPAMAAFTGCSNDSDDLPEVNMEVTISGGVQDPVNNKIYIEQGNDLIVESIAAVPTNGKKTTVGLTTYYLNGLPQFQTVTMPFGCTLSTQELAVGEYAFQIKSAVYQVDKSPAIVLMSYDLAVEQPGTGPEVPGTSKVTPDQTQIAQQ